MECSKVVIWDSMICVFRCLRVRSFTFCPVCMNTAQAASSAAKQLPELSALLQQLSEQRRQQHRERCLDLWREIDGQVFSDGKLKSFRSQTSDPTTTNLSCRLPIFETSTTFNYGFPSQVPCPVRFVVFGAGSVSTVRFQWFGFNGSVPRFPVRFLEHTVYYIVLLCSTIIDNATVIILTVMIILRERSIFGCLCACYASFVLGAVYENMRKQSSRQT